MTPPITSLDLRYLPIEAVRPVRPVERREEEQKVEAASSETQDRKGSSRGNSLRVLVEDERKALAALTPVRANLSPSDEVAIFGDEQNHTASNITLEDGVVSKVTAGNAVDETGESVAVEIIAPQALPQAAAEAEEEKVVALNVRAQVQAARAYARNNDIVFNNAPATLLAA